MGKTNVPPFMTFFDMRDIQIYGVLNHEKQLQKHSDICRKSRLFAENYLPPPQVRRKGNILWRSAPKSQLDLVQTQNQLNTRVQVES